VSLTGVVLAAGTAVFKSGSEIVSKQALISDTSPYTTAWAVRFFALPFILIALVITGIPSVSSNYFLAIGINGPASIVASILYMKGLQKSDISIVSPLSALSPILLFATTPFIVQEVPSVRGVIGVVVVVAGVYILKLESAGTTDVLAPFKSVYSEEGARYIFGMITIYAFTAPIDKLGVEAASPVFYTFGVHVVLVLGLTPFLLYHDGHKELFESWSDAKELASIGALSGMAAILQMTALTYTLVIYVISVKRLGILLSVVYGTVRLDEGTSRTRVIGSAIILVGTILISLSV
jgi:drug/metabolite transporter (DMT)-like permease